MNCVVIGCDRQARYKNGLCPAHYERIRTKGDLGLDHPPRHIIGREDRACAFCGRLFEVEVSSPRRFCKRACYGARASRIRRGEAHPNFKGRIAAAGGYIRIFKPGHPLARSDGYIQEHRLVLFEAGIDVPGGSEVHHINGDRADNRLENLAVLVTADHCRLHLNERGWVRNQYGRWPIHQRAGGWSPWPNCQP